jgi:hypothetical protein
MELLLPASGALGCEDSALQSRSVIKEKISFAQVFGRREKAKYRRTVDRYVSVPTFVFLKYACGRGQELTRDSIHPPNKGTRPNLCGKREGLNVQSRHQLHANVDSHEGSQNPVVLIDAAWSLGSRAKSTGPVSRLEITKTSHIHSYRQRGSAGWQMS